MDITPHQSESYEPGAILEHSWGYDQTNIDFFVIVKRSDTARGDTWLTLQAMTSRSVETARMQGNCTPHEINAGAKPFRRKLAKQASDGMEIGVGIHSYGWCSLWDGKPAHTTSYA